MPNVRMLVVSMAVLLLGSALTSTGSAQILEAKAKVEGMQ